MIASATLATLVLSAGPALAAQHGHGGGARSTSGGSHVQASRQAATAPARSAPVRSVAQAAPRAVSPQAAARPVYPQRAYGAVRTVGSPVIVGQGVARPGYGNYAVAGRPAFVGGGYAGGYAWRGGFAFSRPFFTFRPRFTLGFGLIVGYPVAFPYGYYYSPYDYGYGYPVYGMAEPVPVNPGDGYYGSTAAPANTANYGGVTFDIQPVDAAVFVDGKYIGTVAEFSPQQPPLSLTLGRHHVDLRAQGFQTLSFDLDVVAGQVTPYQGAMTVVK